MTRKGFTDQIFLSRFVHFLARERKQNQKKAPVSRLTLRVGNRAGERRNSLRSNRPTLFSRPYSRCSARDKGEKPERQTVNSPPCRGYLMPPALQERIHAHVEKLRLRSLLTRARPAFLVFSHPSGSSAASHDVDGRCQLFPGPGEIPLPVKQLGQQIIIPAQVPRYPVAVVGIDGLRDCRSGISGSALAPSLGA